MSQNLLRAATKQDYTQILKQWVSLSEYLPKQHYQPFGDVILDERTAQLERALVNTLDSQNAEIFVCERDLQVIASCSVVLNTQEGYSQPNSSVIFNLWVNEMFRRKGVASQLLEKVYHWLDHNNVDSVQVGWHPENVEADAFWKKHGFSQYEVIAAHRILRSG